MSQDKQDEGIPADPRPDRPSWVEQDPFGPRQVPDPAPSPPSPAASAAAPPERSGRSAGEERIASSGPARGIEDGEGDPADVVGAARSATGRPARRRRTTEEVTPRAAGRGSGLDAHHGIRVLGLPIWGWVVLALVTVAVLLIVFDVRNRNRFRLVCQGDHLLLQQGRRLMWPFGFETVGGAFKPVTFPPEADCPGRQSFDSQTEAEAAFLDLLLAEIRRARASNPGAAQLVKLRALALQAMQVTRHAPHNTRRKQAAGALADIAYQQGRAGLARVEHELRAALGHLQEAQQRAADRYEDLEEWIEHLESLLRTVAPAPGTPVQPRALPVPSSPWGAAPPLAPSPSAPGLAPPPDGGVATDDATLPEKGPRSGGILM